MNTDRNKSALWFGHAFLFVGILGFTCCVGATGTNARISELAAPIQNSAVPEDPSPPELEKLISERLERFIALSQSEDPRDDSKLDKLNEEIQEMLRKNGSRRDVLEYSFPKLRELMGIATSPDGKLRFYSWDDMTGGTWRFNRNVIQFESTGGNIKVVVVDHDDPSTGSLPVYHRIFQFEAEGRTIYLANSTGIFSTRLAAKFLDAMWISDDELKPAMIFETDEGLSDSLMIDYDFFSVVDRKERPIKLFEFDPKTKTLRHPYIEEEEGKEGLGKVTDKWVTYKFADGRFGKVE